MTDTTDTTESTEHNAGQVVVRQPDGRTINLTNDPQVLNAHAQALAAVARTVDDALGGLPSGAQATGRLVTESLTHMRTAPEKARAQVASALGDLDIHPHGRNARALAALDEAEADIDKRREEAEARVDVLEAQLIATALPNEKDNGKAALTRQDAQLFLSMSKKPADALAALAADPEPSVRALVAGPWGRRYLAASGITGDDLDLAMSHTQRVALETTAAGVGDQAAAATAAQRIDTLRSAIGSTAHTARRTLR